MRITDMDVVLPSEVWPRSLYLKITAENGMIGLAEAPKPLMPGPLLAILDALKKNHLHLLDAERPASVAHYLLSLESGEPNPILATAIALVEMACWDIAARVLNIPLHRLFGGAIRDRVTACATHWEPEASSSESLTETSIRVSRLGYKTLQFNPFLGISDQPVRSDLGRTIRSCEAVRAAIGPDVALWIDFGSRFFPTDAYRMAKALERLEPAGILDPLLHSHRHQLLNLSRRIAVPLALGASSYHGSNAREAIVTGAISLIQVDPSTTAGFAATRTLAALAETHGVEVSLRSHGRPISEACAIHFGSTLPNLKFAEHVVCSPITTSSVEPFVVDGSFAVSNSAGIGVDEKHF